MLYTVNLKVTEQESGLQKEVNINLDVSQYDNGFYIASNHALSNVVANGTAPVYAILEYLSAYIYGGTYRGETEAQA